MGDITKLSVEVTARLADLGVTSLSQLWADHSNKAVQEINRALGSHLDQMHSAHMAIGADLDRLAKYTATVAAQVASGQGIDPSWLTHYSARIADHDAKMDRLRSRVFELMHIRSTILGG